MLKSTYLTTAILILTGFSVWWYFGKKEVLAPSPITTFEECVAGGNPIAESYPRQCRFGSQTFTENIGNELDITNLIRVSTPRPNQVISSPLTIEGEARGFWFFEGSFPIVLTDWDGLIIAEGIATAKGEWMTEGFVPFTATLEFKNPKYKNNGTLILRRDNPSGLSENDKALEIPIIYEKINSPATRLPPTTILPYDSGIQGSVSLGPICPVMRNPPDPKCDDKPYQTTVQIIAIGSPKSSPFATVETDKEGQYRIMLPPGNYAVQPVGGTPLPRCATENVTVMPGVISKVNISCDTGIR